MMDFYVFLIVCVFFEMGGGGGLTVIGRDVQGKSEIEDIRDVFNSV